MLVLSAESAFADVDLSSETGSPARSRLLLRAKTNSDAVRPIHG